MRLKSSHPTRGHARQPINCFVLVGLVLGGVPIVAQAAAPAPAESVPSSTEPVVELSPFEVRAENDVGYQAANTTSGSRLNSRLKDTPASVSAFTPEFLADIAATNLEEMLGHATNVEIDVEDSNAGFNNPQGRGADGNDYQFRMRGSPGGASRDFVESSVPVDLYNVERAEVASGPNSILFGLGQAGGLVSLTGKKANLNRDRGTLKTIFGSWSFERYEGDYNKVIVPRKLSLRLLGMYQNSQGWRKWNFSDQARWTTAAAYQPFRGTTINVSFEKGHMDNGLTLGWNAQDQITGWEDAGSPVFDATSAQPGTGTSRISATTNRFIFNHQDGLVYNYRGEFETNNRYGAETLVPPSVVPYDYSLTGPGGVRHQTFNTRQLQVQQRFPKDVVVELAYFRNVTDVEANGMTPTVANYRADPNLSLPPLVYAANVNLPNPYAGRKYFEARWFKDWIITQNEVYRLSAAWDVGSSKRWFGRHRIAGLLEDSHQDRLRRWRDEILVDQFNVPISNATNAEAAANQLYRRNYIVEGDYNTYYGGNPSIPLEPFIYQGREIHATYASRGRANTQTVKDINTLMFASQSFWFKDRLVTTLGTRRDDIKFQNAREARVAADDPRVQSGMLSAGEWYFNGEYTRHHYKPTTFTAGAVAHVTRRISLFYNMSKNNGTPRFDRTVLPYGDVPEPTEGRGRDMGIMLDILGDERYFIRTTWFETKQLKDAPILPGGNDIGVDNLRNMLDALLGAGKITQAEFDQQNVTWTSATIDVNTNGLEIEAVANPTRNLTLRASYSHSKRRRENFFTEVFQFFDTRIPQWRQLLANNPDELRALEDAAAAFYSEMAYQVDRQNSPFGTRPHKLNGTARYAFREGRLKGLSLGGSIRYNGKNFLSWDRETGHIFWGNETLLGDVFASYRMRVPRTKMNLTLQLNVKNVSDSYRVNVGRYNDTYTGVRRVYLNEPRSYRFTSTLEF